ncbi:MAG: sulfatase [Pirellulaceae bacterium]
MRFACQLFATLSLVLTICFSTTASAADADESAARRPNVLFIAIDDLNDWIGCLDGHPLAKTPHMDALAARGTLFTNAHCQAPLCNPSRTSLLTGLRPSTTGVYGLAPWIRSADKFKDVVTLPRHFAANGYRTLAAGKIFHGGYPPGKEHAAEMHVWGPPSGVGVRPPQKLVDTPAKHPLVDWGTFPHRDEEKGDWRVASWGVEQLETLPPDQPFFLAVGFFLPHVPCYATQKWFDMYPNDESILPPVRDDDRDDIPRFASYLHWRLPEPRLKWAREANEWVSLARAYLACTSFVDSQVGRVLTALENSPHADNTIVVLWSDHGWHVGEKLITGKNTLWERSTRVPLMFAGPGIAEGAKCQSPAELLDLYPTLIELCELSERPGLEGHSLAPQLKDAAAPRPWPAITTHNHDNHTVRTERWRFIQYADGSRELYDMQSDPNEWTNVAADPGHADLVKELAAWLPKTSADPLPGSAHRVLTYKDGVAVWEGEAIDPEAALPD